eukprot:Gb_39986 [translate_table: standard]
MVITKILPFEHQLSYRITNETTKRTENSVLLSIPDEKPGVPDKLQPPLILTCGYLNTIAKAVGYLCPTDLIPPYIYVDLSNLDVGEKVLMRDLEVHKSLKLLSQDDSLPICKIMGTRPVDDATTQSTLLSLTDTNSALMGIGCPEDNQ